MTLPRRFIGYGAYNLAFDRDLGRQGTDPRNYFEFLSDGGSTHTLDQLKFADRNFPPL